MRILFDQGTAVPLRRSLSGHDVATAYELGWSTVTNGDLIRLAEQEGYELLITTDTNLRYQQNLKDRNLAILALTTIPKPPATPPPTGPLECGHGAGSPGAGAGCFQSGGHCALKCPPLRQQPPGCCHLVVSP